MGQQKLMSDLLSHAVFRSAVSEIECQGIRITEVPTIGALPYAVIGGRSNARWWLVPLHDRRAAASGLAMFQPLVATARLMKAAAVTMSLLGLARVWARRRVYIAGEPSLGTYFGRRELRYAWFTGTDSPHRKVAVQIMDSAGQLLGFAKVSSNPAVIALLQHEAAMLRRIKGLGLSTVHIPAVLYAGAQEGCSVLVTDTLKSTFTRSTTRFGDSHRRFLQEFWSFGAAGTRTAEQIATALEIRVSGVRSKLDADWQTRLRIALSNLRSYGGLPIRVGLTHGDFTPWNTFHASGRLYVFDWEYAEEKGPLASDLFHFVLNEPKIRTQPAAKKLQALRAALNQPWIAEPAMAFEPLVIAYGVSQVLRQLERLAHGRCRWDGEVEQAALFDALVKARKRK